jgi:metallo-beta-lactamase family protein
LANGGALLRIHGQEVNVHAEVVQLASSSAHADANQLLDWLRRMKKAPDQVYVVHGEPEAADALRQQIEHSLKWRALVPELGSTWPT